MPILAFPAFDIQNCNVYSECTTHLFEVLILFSYEKGVEDSRDRGADTKSDV
jgi:hypothetical protein